MHRLYRLLFKPDRARISGTAAHHATFGRFCDDDDLPDAPLHQHFVRVFFKYYLDCDQARFRAICHKLAVCGTIAGFHWTEVIIDTIKNRGRFSLHDIHLITLCYYLTGEGVPKTFLKGKIGSQNGVQNEAKLTLS